ncbi:helix-turn-helix domain-containing protein [Novilysobacter antarcticus]|uniref:helix-turn-helix domain-containing protein n=1 Tax=Novilysobacter antarcticus TaxID=2862543 RepID=UPI003CCDCC5E
MGTINGTPGCASECLSLSETAELLRMGVDATRDLITTGELPALSLNRKHLVILRDDVINFVREAAKRQQRERKDRHVRCAANDPTDTVHEVDEPQRRNGGRRRRQPPPI